MDKTTVSLRNMVGGKSDALYTVLSAYLTVVGAFGELHVAAERDTKSATHRNETSSRSGKHCTISL